MPGGIAGLARAFADELLPALRELTSCSADDIRNYTGAAYVEMLGVQVPQLMGLIKGVLRELIVGREHNVQRTTEEANHSIVEIFCSLAKYASRAFQHPLRVAQSWFVKAMYKSALLTDILQKEAPGGLSSAGVQLIVNHCRERVAAPGEAFVQKYLHEMFIVMYSESARVHACCS